MLATDLHPDLPIFPSRQCINPPHDPASTISPRQPHANASSPPPPFPNSNTVATTYPYDDDIPYPKPGNGIVLPPESADLEWLVDDDYETFSHTVLGVPVRMRDVLLMAGPGTGAAARSMAVGMEMGVGNATRSGMQGQGQGHAQFGGMLGVGA